MVGVCLSIPEMQQFITTTGLEYTLSPDAMMITLHAATQDVLYFLTEVKDGIKYCTGFGEDA